MKARRLRQFLASWLYRLLPPPIPEIPKSAYDNSLAAHRARGTKVGDNTRIYGVVDRSNPHLVEIGSHCVIGTHSALLAHCPIRGGLPVKIGDYVYIGFGVLVLPGVEVGSCSILGAGAVVTRNIPAKSIAVGNPARVLRQLTDEECESLCTRLRERQRMGHVPNPNLVVQKSTA